MPFPAQASAPVCRPLYLRLFVFIYRSTRAKFCCCVKKVPKEFRKLQTKTFLFDSNISSVSRRMLRYVELIIKIMDWLAVQRTFNANFFDGAAVFGWEDVATMRYLK